MIWLSYSTINNTINCNKYYLNHKVLGTPSVTFDYFTLGKEAHDIIQKHVSGTQEDPRLTKAGVSLPEFKFPIVEKIDFDPETKFEIPFNDNYGVIGYLDGLDPDGKRFLEIKTGAKAWSMGQFIQLPQRKIYALAHPDYTKMIAITTNRDLSEIKKYELNLTEKDREDAKEFIQKGIDIIEEGLFEGGEKVDCPRCVFRDACQWRV